MTTPMALHNYPLLVFTLLIISFTRVLSINVFMKSTLIYPLNCSNNLQICSSYLYHISKGLEIEQIASSYSVNITQVKPITHGTKKDYLISVPCTCRDVKGTQGYFYDTLYKVQQGDTFFDVTSEFYSGQALKVAGEEEQFIAGNIVTIHLACGCMEGSQKVVTYTVQDQDTLTGIAELLSADLDKIESLNGRLTKNPGFIDVGWVLFVPMEKIRTHAPKEGIRHNWKIIIGILSGVISFSVGTLMLYLLKRNRTQGNREENPKALINRTQGNREENPEVFINRTSLENQHLIFVLADGRNR